MRPPPGIDLRRIGTAVTNVGLGGAAAIHLAWAAGVDWPANSRDELADLVVGVRPFPSAPMTLGVVAVIGLGAGLVAREADLVSRDRAVGKQDDRSGITQRGLRLGAYGVPTVMALRGFGGMAVSAFELRPATERFRYWDLRVYSPLCIILALATAASVWPNDPRAGRP